MKKVIKYTLYILLLVIACLAMAGALYSKCEFRYEGAEEYYFYLTNGIGNSDYSMLGYAISHYVWHFLILLFILLMLIFNPFKIKDTKYYPIKLFYNHKGLWTFIFFVLITGISIHMVDIDGYIINNFRKSDIIDKNYQVTTKEDITFKKKKKNLVFMIVESLETSLIDKEHGGDWDYNVIPELNDIRNMDEAIYFSSDDKGKGTLNLYGTTYTTASVITNNLGLPFKIPINHNTFNKETYFNDVYGLGDILKDNGYHNEVISGAQLAFGALDNLFKKHGDYKVYDPRSLKKMNIKLSKEDKGNWGFNDKYLFELAKERVSTLAKEKEPFNLTLITIDTHPIDGFKSSYTLDKFDVQYENVYATESKLISDFINWLKEEDYYEDTVVVIVGDHLCMQTNIVNKHKLENRGRYNVILNSSVTTDNKYNREFTALDTTPTILAALGATINNNKIGLGVNLFSEEKTLVEKYDFDYVNKELAKQSDLYTNLITKK